MTNRIAEIAKAREIDNRISAAWNLYHAEMDKTKSFNSARKDAVKAIARRKKYSDDFENTMDFAHYTWIITNAEAMVAEITAAAAPLAAVARELDKSLYTGWNRFFLVEHIHSSQHCSSFRDTTRVGWLPDVSGLTEAEAVAAHGSILCTICFPSAPVEHTSGTAIASDGRCAGSGTTIYNGLDSRMGYYSGNWATCPDCGKRVGISRNGQKIPKHNAI